MYWPTSVVRSLALPAPLDHEPIIKLRQNRRGNFFITLTKSGLGVWDVRPTVLQAALVRTPRSLERWGSNVDVCWAHDGRGIVTSNSHLLVYQLQPTSQPSYDHPITSHFSPTGGAGEADTLMGWTIKSLGVAFIMGGCESMSAQAHSLSFTLRHPPAILTVPCPIPLQLLAPPGSHFPPPPMDGDGEDQVECEVLDMNELKGWMRSHGESAEGQIPVPRYFGVHRAQGTPAVHVMIMEDGRVWGMYLARSRRGTVTRSLSARSASSIPPSPSNEKTPGLPSSNSKYIGQPLYPLSHKRKSTNATEDMADMTISNKTALVSNKAVTVAVNPRFGQIAIGTEKGRIDIISLPHPSPAHFSHRLDLKHSANLRVSPGAVTALAWTSDGYALAVGYEHAWAVWTVGGRLNGWGMALAEGDGRSSGAEGFLHGVLDLFWAPGNLELFVLANPTEQLYSIPFAKSATTGIHSPDNTRYAFLQMDDRVLVYRGADQPDMSVINPESDVWQQIKVSPPYMSANWPMRYASLSTDGKLVAIAGRRGLTHYSVASGKWKLYTDARQEQDFTVRGGMLWFHHVLVVAVDVDKGHQIRLYSRDQDLNDANILHSYNLPSSTMVMSLLDNSLLVYTADNTLYHFLILPTSESIRLHMCGSISFAGIVQVPSRVRSLSWLIPEAQKRLGDPADDLIVATIIFLTDGQLVLLRPRRAGSDEVRYDMQILADRIECYWTHLQGVGTLENSLWGWDGTRMRVWLDALTIEHTKEGADGEGYERVRESVGMRLDFYPLSILMDKGIIIGIDYEQSTRALPFSLYKIQTSTHLFLPQFMRHHLDSTSLHHALMFADNYRSIVYFSHALEVLLHSVLEDAPAQGSAAASVVGTPATSTLPSPAPMTSSSCTSPPIAGGAGGEMTSSTIALNTPPQSPPRPSPLTRTPSDTSPSTSPALQAVIEFLDYFEQSLDVVVGCARKTEMERWPVLFGAVGAPRELYEACLNRKAWRSAAGFLLVLHHLEELHDVEDTVKLIRLAMQHGEYQLCKELLRFMRSIDDTGSTLRDAVAQLGLAEADASAVSAAASAMDSASVPLPQAAAFRASGLANVPTPISVEATPVPAAIPVDPHTTLERPTLKHMSSGLSSAASLSSVAMAPSVSSTSSLGTPGRNPRSDRVTSPFHLESPRMILSPPSPKTVAPGYEGKVPDPPTIETP